MNDLVVSETVEKITAFIGQQQSRFIELNRNGINKLDFAKECEFAKQLLLKNDYVLGVARGNPDSLQTAIANVAAIGITLNPALSFAYLVPRTINKKPSICLDISYRGLTKLATDTGIIKAMKAELIYEHDTFEYKGFHEVPKFSANPFGDRGKLIGVYAMALLTDGTVLVETMSVDEVNKIRDDSEAYKSALAKGGWTLENNVWVKFYTEMVKKTVIKRAYKTLPTSKGTEIMGKAIEVINEHEGIDFEKPEAELFYSEEEQTEYQRCIDDGDWQGLCALIKTLCAEAQTQLYSLCTPTPEKGMKGKKRDEFKRNLGEAEKELEATLVILRGAVDDNEESIVQEILSESSQWVIDYFMKHMNPEQQMQINQMREAA